MAGPDGTTAPFHSGPNYVLSSGLARSIFVRDRLHTTFFYAYGSSSEDANMGKWVQYAEQVRGVAVRKVKNNKIAFHPTQGIVPELRPTKKTLDGAEGHRGGAIRARSRGLFAFTIRDSHRVTPMRISDGLHIFDYVDVHAENQTEGTQKLFLDGYPKETSPCHVYSHACYKQKMLQVFRYVSSHHGSYSLYMEGDNHLCMSLDKLERLAFSWKRYFVSTGVGASGWFMSLEFVHDFVEYYAKSGHNDTCPDCVAADMLTVNGTRWAVTRQHFVEHDVKQDTLGLSGEIKKHLPRCFEPHRGKWGGGTHDKYGWDYFDYDECPEADIYPCSYANNSDADPQNAASDGSEELGTGG